MRGINNGDMDDPMMDSDEELETSVPALGVDDSEDEDDEELGLGGSVEESEDDDAEEIESE